MEQEKKKLKEIIIHMTAENEQNRNIIFLHIWLIS